MFEKTPNPEWFMVLGSDGQTAGGVWAVPLMLGHRRGETLVPFALLCLSFVLRSPWWVILRLLTVFVEFSAYGDRLFYGFNTVMSPMPYISYVSMFNPLVLIDESQ